MREKVLRNTYQGSIFQIGSLNFHELLWIFADLNKLVSRV